MWVTDRGAESAENRRYLQRAGGHYITGEKLRGESAEAKAALARQGRYQVVAGNLQVKEVVLDEGVMRDRFVVCRNPAEATRDAAVRDRLLGQLEAAIAGSDALAPAARAKLACDLHGTPTNRRFLRTTGAGLLRIDRAAVAADARLDGKFLLRTSDPTLSAADVATGYKQLLEVERAWRDMQTTLDLRPVYHRREARIARTSCSAGSPCCSSGSPRTPPARPGATCARSSTSSTSGVLSDRQEKSPSGPRSQRARRPSSRPLVSPSRPATSGWPPRRLHRPPSPADPSRPHAPSVA